MRHFSNIALAALAVLFLTLPGFAQNKFKNEDTAKDRRDNTFGTGYREEGADIAVGKDEHGTTVIRSTSTPKEEVDWYDKIWIEVEPRVDWPKDTSTTSTTTEKEVAPSGDVTTTTTTTETRTETP